MVDLGKGYDKRYYLSNKQTDDRIALSFYHRLAVRYVRKGKVLDYGCGTGHLIKRFGKGYEAWAYDISSYATESVRRVAPGVNICSIPESLSMGTFNLIISIHVLEHIELPERTLEFFWAALKEDGILMYVVPNVSGFGRALKKQRWSAYGDPSHVSLYPAGKWLSLTEKTGFSIIRSGTDGLWDVPYLRYLPIWFQKMIFYPMPAIQVAFGRLILPSTWGESLVVLAQKKIS